MNKSAVAAGNWLFYAWAVSVVATLGSLYLSEVVHFVPCSLCWFQRIFMYPLVWLLGVASAKRNGGFAIYALPLVGIGAAVSGYHIYIQEMPSRAVGVACGPTSCVTDVLNAFGFLTVPMLALTAFAFIGFCLVMARRAARASASEDHPSKGESV